VKLGNFLKAAPHARPVNPRPITLRVIGKDEGFRPIVADARAVLVFVSADERQAAHVEARAALSKRFPNKEIADLLDEEAAYHVLYRALRDADPGPTGAYQPFADSLDELRGALVAEEAGRVWRAYQAFVAEEFPEDKKGPPQAETFRPTDQ